MPFLSFKEVDGGLLVDNNEDGFEADNVKALCGIGMSTKQKARGFIGEKGIGFKSVFKVADEVFVCSNKYSFKFNTSKPLGMIAPEWVEVSDLPFQRQEGHTQIYLKYKADISSTKLHEQLLDLHAHLLLFLRKIRQLVVTTTHQHLLFQMNPTHGNKVEIVKTSAPTTELQATKQEKMHFLVHRETVDIPEELQEDNRDNERKDVKQTEIVLAFPLGVDDPPPAQNMHAFLPIRQYGFRFIIQGDFLVPVSRESIFGGKAWNELLLSSVPMAFVKAVEAAKKSRQTEVAICLGCVPLDGEVSDSLVQKTAEGIVMSLKEVECIRTQAGSWSHPHLTCPMPAEEEFFYLASRASRGVKVPIFNNRQLQQATGKQFLDPSLLRTNRLRRVLLTLGRVSFELEDFMRCLASCRLCSDTMPLSWYQAVYKYLNRHADRLTEEHLETLQRLPLLFVKNSKLPRKRTSLGPDVFMGKAVEECAQLPGLANIVFLDPDRMNSAIKLEGFFQKVFHVHPCEPLQIAKKVLELYKDGTATTMAADLNHSDLLVHVNFVLKQAVGHRISQQDLSCLLLRCNTGRYHVAAEVYLPARTSEYNAEDLTNKPFLHQQYATERITSAATAEQVIRECVGVKTFSIQDFLTSAQEDKARKPRPREWYKQALLFIGDHFTMTKTVKSNFQNLPLLWLKDSKSPQSRRSVDGDLFFWKKLPGQSLPGVPELTYLDAMYSNNNKLKCVLADVFGVKEPTTVHIGFKALQMYRDGTVEAMVQEQKHEDLLAHVQFLMEHCMDAGNPSVNTLQHLLVRCSDDRYRQPKDVYFPSSAKAWDLRALVDAPFLHTSYKEKRLDLLMMHRLPLRTFGLGDFVTHLQKGMHPQVRGTEWYKGVYAYLGDSLRTLSGRDKESLAALPLLIIQGALPISPIAANGNVYIHPDQGNIDGLHLPGLQRMKFMSPEVVDDNTKPGLTGALGVKVLKTEEVVKFVLQLHTEGVAVDMANRGEHEQLLEHVKFIAEHSSLARRCGGDLKSLLLRGSDGQYHLGDELYYSHQGDGWCLPEMMTGPFLHQQYLLGSKEEDAQDPVTRTGDTSTSINRDAILSTSGSTGSCVGQPQDLSNAAQDDVIMEDQTGPGPDTSMSGRSQVGYKGSSLLEAPQHPVSVGEVLKDLLELATCPRIRSGCFPPSFTGTADISKYEQCLHMVRENFSMYKDHLTPGSRMREALSSMAVRTTTGEVSKLKEVYFPSPALTEYFGTKELPYLAVTVLPSHNWQVLDLLGVESSPTAGMLLKCLRWMKRRESVDVAVLSKVYGLLQLKGDEEHEVVRLAFEDEELIFSPSCGWEVQESFKDITDRDAKGGTWKAPSAVFWEGTGTRSGHAVYLKEWYPSMEAFFRHVLGVRDEGLRDVVNCLKEVSANPDVQLKEVHKLYEGISDLLGDKSTSQEDTSWFTSQAMSFPLLLARKGDLQEWVTSDMYTLYLADDPQLTAMFQPHFHFLDLPSTLLPACHTLLSLLEPRPQRISDEVDISVWVEGKEQEAKLTGQLASWHYLFSRVMYQADPCAFKTLSARGCLARLQECTVYMVDSLQKCYSLDGAPEERQDATSGYSNDGNTCSFFISKQVEAKAQQVCLLATMFAEQWPCRPDVKGTMVMLAIADGTAAEHLCRWLRLPELMAPMDRANSDEGQCSTSSGTQLLW